MGEFSKNRGMPGFFTVLKAYCVYEIYNEKIANFGKPTL